MCKSGNHGLKTFAQIGAPHDAPILAGLLAARAETKSEQGERRSGKRRAIFEIRAASACSVVGTCLSVAELRRLARKAGFVAVEDHGDYDVHGMVVSQMDGDNHVSRAVTKLLDEKFSGPIRKTRGLTAASDFIAFWEEAVAAGLAPGAYWALLTHPAAPYEVEARIYGDVHMMSHLSGAARRDDARALTKLRRERDDSLQKLEQRLAERDRALAARDAELENLRRSARETTAELERLGAAFAAEGDLRAALNAAQSENARLRRESEAFYARAERLREKLAAQRKEPAARPAPPPACGQSDCIGQKEENSDLCGRCLLYVGGRLKIVCQLRDMVAKRNGSLLHHDGGMEQNLSRLSEMVRQADQVFFPVDCVSHSAMEAVKKLCETHGKPMAVLRTASFSAFVRAIETAPAS